MIESQPVWDGLPPPRSKLQRAVARLGAEIDGTSKARRDDIKELCASLAERAFRGRAAPARNDTWAIVEGWIERVEEPLERREWCAFVMAVLGAAGEELLYLQSRQQMQHHPKVLAAMFAERAHWRRRASDWRPPAMADCDECYADLARHLFVKWDMPDFMDGAWHTAEWGSGWKRALYLHMAAGASLRDAPLPYRLTRTQAHVFATATGAHTIESALARADCVSLGASPALAGELARTRLGEGVMMVPARRDYWLSVVRYFVGCPEFAKTHAGEIVDYLWSRLEGGARAGLKVHGRTPYELLRDVRAWHHQLARGARNGRLDATPYPEPPVAPFEAERDGATYRIRRIRHALELREEGVAMANCVFVYNAPCRAGVCSIWSLEEERADGVVRPRATIRVQKGAVIEAKRRANRPVEAGEREVIAAWASREGLRAQY